MTILFLAYVAATWQASAMQVMHTKVSAHKTEYIINEQFIFTVEVTNCSGAAKPLKLFSVPQLAWDREVLEYSATVTDASLAARDECTIIIHIEPPSAISDAPAGLLVTSGAFGNIELGNLTTRSIKCELPLGSLRVPGRYRAEAYAFQRSIPIGRSELFEFQVRR